MSWPCQNGATCAAHYEKNSYVCVCVRGYTGKYCETGITFKMWNGKRYERVECSSGLVDKWSKRNCSEIKKRTQKKIKTELVYDLYTKSQPFATPSKMCICSSSYCFHWNQIPMSALVIRVWTVELALTKWMGSRAAVYRDSGEHGVKQVATCMKLFREVACIAPSRWMNLHSSLIIANFTENVQLNRTSH